MVKRDEGPPKLCFDNPVYNDRGIIANPKETGSKDESNRPHTAIADIRQAPVYPRVRDLTATKSLGEEFLSRTSSCRSHKSVSSDMFSPARALSQEVDVEERIIENTRNRGFWSRKSRNSRRNTSSGTIPKESLSLGKTLSVPSVHEEDEEGTPEECADDESCEVTLEILKEGKLREDVAWIRNFLIEVSEANGGNFSLSAFLTAMKNKVSEEEDFDFIMIVICLLVVRLGSCILPIMAAESLG